MELKNVLLELEDGIMTVTINRPQVLNALNTETLKELRTAIQEAGQREEVKAVIITGAGEKSFVAGADIAQMRDLDVLEGRKMTMLGQDVFNEIENLDKPV
ncbi:MAG: crotonase, partial [Clostridia bacterium]|nr:crotonase [Clostridia bacterium]